MKFLFFAYREWAMNIFKNVSSEAHEIDSGDEYLLFTNKNSCNKEFIDNIKPDYIFFYGWSWIIPNDIINNYTCICLHPSSLPKYRGGSPIQNQIMNEETYSAVTLFKMTEKMDAGPIVGQEGSLISYIHHK